MGKVRVLILGFGRLGRAFSRAFGDRYEIRGIRRNPSSDEPVPVEALSIQSGALLPVLRWAETVIFCPSSGGGDPDHYRDTYIGNIRSVMGQIQDHAIPIRRFMLIGSTGVYPNMQGGIWTEDRDIRAESPRQEILLQTESILIRSGMAYGILRCGGIYGGERANFSRIFRKEKMLTSEMSDSFLSLVHEADICGVMDRLMAGGPGKEIFNVVDDSNLRRRELYTWIAERAGIPIVDDGPPPPAAARVISNAKLKTLLGYHFQFPSVTRFLETRQPSNSDTP